LKQYKNVLVEIYSCRLCPNSQIKVGKISHKTFVKCSLMKPYKKIPGNEPGCWFNIPEWCPLPDANKYKVVEK